MLTCRPYSKWQLGCTFQDVKMQMKSESPRYTVEAVPATEVAGNSPAVWCHRNDAAGCHAVPRTLRQSPLLFVGLELWLRWSTLSLGLSEEVCTAGILFKWVRANFRSPAATDLLRYTQECAYCWDNVKLTRHWLYFSIFLIISHSLLSRPPSSLPPTPFSLLDAHIRILWNHHIWFLPNL